MKKIKLLLSVILTASLLTGCANMHTHQWSEANYQSPSTCSICGLTRGNPLTADFDRYQLKADMQINAGRTYHTICSESEDPTEGTVTVTSVSTGEPSDISGYENQTVTLTAVFSDAASNAAGFLYNYVITDFYDIESFEASFRYSEGNIHTFTVNYNGQDYDKCRVSVTTGSSEWLRKNDVYEKTVTVTWNLTVPQGYDGIVVGLRNSGIDNSGKYFIYEYYNETDFLLFRVNNHENGN